MKNVKVLDIIIIFITLTVILLFSVRVYSQPSENKHVIVEAEENTWMYDLDQDRTVMIPGPLGETEVVIEEGAVHVHDSPCRNKICVSTGSIRRSGQWIICLPNDVFIRIEGTEAADDGQVDDIAF